jgi:hypothetical protein
MLMLQSHSGVALHVKRTARLENPAGFAYERGFSSQDDLRAGVDRSGAL